MRVVANVWDQVQLRPSNRVGAPLRQRRKVRAVLFAANHERLHFDGGPIGTRLFLTDHLKQARPDPRRILSSAF